MTPVIGHDVSVALWVSARVGRIIEPPFTALGFANEGQLVTGFVFNDYVPNGNVEMTIATDVSFQRGMFSMIAGYVFGQIGCRRITIRTPARNKHVQDLASRLGFVRETRLKHYFGNDDAELFRMLKAECRWINENTSTARAA